MISKVNLKESNDSDECLSDIEVSNSQTPSMLSPSLSPRQRKQLSQINRIDPQTDYVDGDFRCHYMVKKE